MYYVCISWLMNGLESHPTVVEVDRRIANVTGLFEGNSEHYQVLRYAATGDQFYKSHSDFIDSQVGQLCGPRLFTFFLYLHDVPEDGGGEICTTLSILCPLNTALPQYCR